MDFANPHFAEPHWLWVALLLPLAVLGLRAYAARRRRRQIARWAAAARAEELLAACDPWRRHLKGACLVLASALLGVALARPQWGEQIEQLQSWGEDVLFALDTSRSMLADDLKPNRLIRAKLAMLDFERQRPRGRFGLLVFAGQAFLQCPLTYDHDAFRESLLGVDEKAIPVPGTDLGRALDEALLAFEKNERRKILVLVTDGEDLEAGGVAMAEKVAAKHIAVYTVGVGTPEGSTLRTLSPQGAPEAVKDERGAPVVSRLDRKTLEEIAQRGGGQYFPLGALGEGMARVRQGIDASLNSTDAVMRRKLGVERFHTFVAAVIVLLVLESLLGERGRPRLPHPPAASPPAKPRPARARAGTTAVAVVLAAASAAVLAATNAPPDAPEEESADVPPPATAREAYNAGTERLARGQLRQAENLLLLAAASQQTDLQSQAIYNLGHVRFRLGLEALKEGPATGPLREQAAAATHHAAQAIQQANAALADPRLTALVAAYQNGRGARKELKAATQAIKKALEMFETTLTRWERASGDFKSARELDPKDADAAFNADVVDRRIAQLVDQLNQVRPFMPMMGGQQEQLTRLLKALREKMPKGQQPDGEEEEDDEEGKQPKEPQKDQREAPNKDGKQKMMSREEALRWLEALRLDGERKLPMNAQQSGQPSNRDNARNW